MADSIRRILEEMKESGSTSDFPYLLGNTLGKTLLTAYRGVNSLWKTWTIQSDVNDFKEQKRVRISEAEEPEIVQENGEYKDSKLAESQYGFTVARYGRNFSVSLETILNDDLRAIEQQPQRMGRACGRKQAKYAVGLLEAVSAATTNVALSEASIITAVNEFRARKDDMGNLLGINAAYLLIPPALEATARRILYSPVVIAVGVGAAAAIQGNLNVASQFSLTPLVEPFLTDDEDWYLLASPSDVPGIEISFLRFYGREPRLIVKRSDVEGWAGFPGSFQNDSIIYGVRHAWGGKVIDANAILRVHVA